jgi:hypothetical protein
VSLVNAIYNCRQYYPIDTALLERFDRAFNDLGEESTGSRSVWIARIIQQEEDLWMKRVTSASSKEAAVLQNTKVRLADIREGFNRRRRRCKLSFDQLRRRFERGDSFANIALSAGVTRSRLRVIYELWFRKLLRLPSGRERRERQQDERRKLHDRNLKKLPRSKAVRAIARAEGIRLVKPVPRDQRSRPGQIRSREVFVRGRLCGVHHLRNSRRQEGRDAVYATTTIYRGPLERQDFKSFYIETDYGIKRIDIETEELLAYFKKRGQSSITIYLPISSRGMGRAGR